MTWPPPEFAESKLATEVRVLYTALRARGRSSPAAFPFVARDGCGVALVRCVPTLTSFACTCAA